MTVVMPPGAHPEATLEVVHQLLHNPPGLHASSSVAEQWHHDINQLIITTINTTPHEEWQANHPGGASVPSMAHSRSPVTPRASSAPCVPPASLATVDLRVELERHRSGEDGCITSMGTSVQRTPPLSGKLLAPLHPQRDLRVAAWHLPHTSVWWSGRTSFGLTCQRNTTGVSTPPSSYRSTLPQSLLQEAMRSSCPTTSQWP
jgi:hypothetical protein